jgi:glycosyltransferase involved in cell wall biosynthesis
VLRTYARRSQPRRFAAYVGRAALGAAIIREQRIDIIAGYNLILGAPIASLLGELFDLPVVISNFGEIYSHRDIVERERELIRRMTERAARLLCMTRHCAESYTLLGLHPEVQIVPYGLDLARFHPGNGMARRRDLGWSEQERIVLFVGRMLSEMGVDTFLAAIPDVLSRFPRARFLLAGGRGELTEAAERAAATLRDIVKVVPDVPGENLPSLYQAADLVVVPTKGARACGSLAAGEAAASGRAVVGARVGGVPEYVIDGETGLLVAPDDPESLARAVCDLLDDDGRRQDMGNAGRAFVERTFDVARTNDAIDRVFREVLASRAVTQTV